MPMSMPQPAPPAVKLFEELIPAAPGVSAKRVFGQPAAFVNGNMFFGVFGKNLFVRLSEDDRAEARQTPGFVTFEPSPGRAMREYMVLPAGVRGDRVRARGWVARSLGYASSLKSKSPKKKGT
jgi:TfoX/Sxy family transcriptional regulator of competence genes